MLLWIVLGGFIGVAVTAWLRTSQREFEASMDERRWCRRLQRRRWRRSWGDPPEDNAR
jgi:hypothetical protein